MLAILLSIFTLITEGYAVPEIDGTEVVPECEGLDAFAEYDFPESATKISCIVPVETTMGVVMQTLLTDINSKGAKTAGRMSSCLSGELIEFELTPFDKLPTNEKGRPNMDASIVAVIQTQNADECAAP